jgi:hypothetical protein
MSDRNTSFAVVQYHQGDQLDFFVSSDTMSSINAHSLSAMLQEHLSLESVLHNSDKMAPRNCGESGNRLLLVFQEN